MMPRRFHLSLRMQLFLLLSVMMLVAGLIWAVAAFKMAHYYLTLSHHQDLTREQQIVKGALVHVKTQTESLFLLLSDQLDKSLKQVDTQNNIVNALLLEKGVAAIFVRKPKQNQWQLVYDDGTAKRWQQLLIEHDTLPEQQIHCLESACFLIFHSQTYTASGQAVEVIFIQPAGEWFAEMHHHLLSDEEAIALISLQDQNLKLYLASNFSLAQTVLTQQLKENLHFPATGLFSEWWLDLMPLPLSQYSQHPLWLVSIRNMSAFQQGLGQMLLASLGALLILWLTMGWLIIWAANRKLHSIKRLSEATSLATQGKLQEALVNLPALNRRELRDEITLLRLHMRRMLQNLLRRTNQLQWMAYHDTLTGLPNRRSFHRHLSAQYQQGTGALLFIDVNRFKQVNDLFGHETGDRLLKEVADKLKAWQENCEHPCSVFRLGGDEFTMIFHEPMTADTLKTHMQALTKRLQGQIQLPQGEKIFYDLSVGGVLIDPNEPLDRLLHQADVAMYKAKHSHGTTHWHLFDPGQDEDIKRIEEEHRLLQWMREKLGSDAFSLVYQPIAETTTGQIKHFEVLMRLKGPDGQPVSPATFIPLAERFGLILEIDQWVMAQALEKLKQLPTEIGLSINLSAPSMQRPDLIKQISHLVEHSDSNPQRLMIELTETAYVSNLTQAEHNLKGLKRLGFKLALDDFGVGFSSFNYLSKLPIDYVKLDGSYIRDLPQNPHHQAFVTGITTIAHGFNMKLVAEFVENEAIVTAIRKLNIDYMQGYHISPPRDEPIIPD
ncbi:MAG TPA: EAL domain-containing protein [Sulfurivirga caldicuralii]|nr:EAL domain-containing protein [Sulfurivirga caldicuralii]